MLAYISYPSWIRPQIVPFLPIRWYGLMYLVAFTVAYLLFRYQMRERGMQVSRDLVLDMFFWGIVGLLVGARAFAVTIYDPTGYYLRHPLQIILPFSYVDGKLQLTGIAGMSYHGGLVGAVLAIVIYLKVKKLGALEWGDMLVSGIPLGYTFGRLGNFINGELYGRITRVSWGMVFPDAQAFPAKDAWVQQFASSVGVPVPGSGMVNLPRHPSQLYEAFLEGIVLWLVMWFIVRKRRPYNGFAVAWYIIGYGTARFLVEYTREPDIGIGYPITLVPVANPGQFTPFNFSTGQILSFLMAAAGVVCLFLFRWLDRRRTEAAAVADQRQRLSGRKLRKKLR